MTRLVPTSSACPRPAPSPAYEDAAHFVLVEQKLPLNVTPATTRSTTRPSASASSPVFDRGLETPVGYVLPIQVWQAADRGRRWVTERWALRRGKLFLMPGDSPVGFRLPLGSLPALPAVDYPHVLPRDPFADAPPLPERRALMQRRRSRHAGGAAGHAAVGRQRRCRARCAPR